MKQCVSYKSLYCAWQTCRKGKSAGTQAQMYEANVLENLHNTQQLMATMASYYGHVAHAKYYRQTMAIFKQYYYLSYLYHPINIKNKGLKPCITPLQVTGFKAQCYYFSQSINGYAALTLIQKGYLLVVSSNDAQIISPIFVRQAKKITQKQFSYPLKSWALIRQQLLNNNLSYQFITEQGYLKGGLKKRVLKELFINNHQINPIWSDNAPK